ncbi:MAG: hypothetical protein JWN70_7183 [Planctomycetaceae bacterium]|nr:hypothetical protein [Planctomycetaceae bacterium]
MRYNAATIEMNMRRWDIFCRVVDNYGDIGVCWRLARQLAEDHGADVRLWVDDLASFSKLCPSISTDATEQHVGSIEVRRWTDDFPSVDVAEVVVEAFACELPASYIDAMARREVAPVWINLEYLSAEGWVEDCHRLASPRSNSTLTKHFFFPGFTPRTGGLPRERRLLADRAAFDSAAEAEFWSSLGTPGRSADETRISLFCYENTALPELLRTWSEGPCAVRLLVTPGAATAQVQRWFGREFPGTGPLETGFLTAHALPFLPQAAFDRLLWACDVNFVRGEDSFVRAQWAQRPFVWQIYPQAENVHLAKLDAFLDRYLAELKPPSMAEAVRRCWQAWNFDGDIGAGWLDFAENRQSVERHGKVWASQLDQAGNLANNLVCFVSGK